VLFVGLVHVYSNLLVVVYTIVFLPKNSFDRFSFWMEHPTKPLYDLHKQETIDSAAYGTQKTNEAYRESSQG
jgi:hypothetical protein